MTHVPEGGIGLCLMPEATLPYGVAVKKTEAVEKRLVEAAHRIAGENGGEELVEGIFALINGNVSEVRVMLTPPQQRPLSTAEFTRLWRQEIGGYPRCRGTEFQI